MSAGNPERVADLKSRKGVADSRKAVLEEQLKKEKELVSQIREKRAAIEKRQERKGGTREGFPPIAEG